MKSTRNSNRFGDESSIKFDDGFVVTIGDVVSFHTRHGSVGNGKVTAIKRGRVFISPNYAGARAILDGWKLNGGGDYDRLRDAGVFGGEIVR